MVRSLRTTDGALLHSTIQNLYSESLFRICIQLFSRPGVLFWGWLLVTHESWLNINWIKILNNYSVPILNNYSESIRFWIIIQNLNWIIIQNLLFSYSVAPEELNDRQLIVCSTTNRQIFNRFWLISFDSLLSLIIIMIINASIIIIIMLINAYHYYY